MTSRFLTYSVLLCLGTSGSARAASLCDSVSANLVANCGFETGDFTDWDTTPALSGSFFGVSTTDPHSGSYSAAFGAYLGDNDYIEQFLATTPGTNYDITFYLDASQQPTPGEFVANWDGSNLVTVEGDVPGGYQSYTFSETATSTSTEIQFGANSPPSFYYLDDIIVTPGAGTVSTVPEPSTTFLIITGLLALSTVARRKLPRRGSTI